MHITQLTGERYYYITYRPMLPTTQLDGFPELAQFVGAMEHCAPSTKRPFLDEQTIPSLSLKAAPPSGISGMGRPIPSLGYCFEFGRSFPLTATPASLTVTVSPARAAIGFSNGAYPSPHPKLFTRYSLSIETFSAIPVGQIRRSLPFPG